MKLILIEDVIKLGKAGDVVSVSPGYGRNFLLPKKIAVLATPKSMKNLDAIKKAAEEKALRAESLLKATALDIDGIELTFFRKADETGHLYGSVSDNDIVNAINEKGFDIHRNMIKGDKHIKELGNYTLTVSFTPKIQASINVIIRPED